MFMFFGFALGIFCTIVTQRWWRRNKQAVKSFFTAPLRAVKRK
jgi:hypothetical protein